ncbi:MAG TPA: aspartate 1-decarboxylase [Actinobacteria bacterium]|nr:aspartate 1-decarboxylase [Actinomycetota bacterium]
MFRIMLKSKIHGAIVTEANLEYEGSITIDKKLLEAADILPYEKVQVVDLSNGARLETYAIEADTHSGIVCINGAAARLIHKGDKIIIMCYASVDECQASKIYPKIVYVDEKNKVVEVSNRMPVVEEC